MVICSGLFLKLWRDGRSLLEIISAVGSIASLFGLIIAILQIQSVKVISVATQRAVADTKAQLVQNISISDLAQAIKLIEQIQEYLGYSKFELAYVRLQDLRVLLIQFVAAHSIEEYEREEYENLLKDIGIHSVNLYDAVYKDKVIRVSGINKTLHKALEILIASENQLKLGVPK